MEIKEFEKLFEEVKQRTGNFKELTPEIIAENSQTIVVFRTLMSLSAERFAILCGRSKGSIGSINYLERKRRTIPIRVAKVYFDENLSELEKYITLLLRLQAHQG
jgi:hypothetical protein